MRIFKNKWDAVPAGLAFGHFALVLLFAWAWPHLSWPARIAGGAVYAFSVGWSLDSVSHNFIHNPFFTWKPLNIATSFVLSWSCGISQTMYEYVHWLHHLGNADKPGADGETVDPISVYKFGREGRAEPMLPYVFQAFFRDDDPFTIIRKIREKKPALARQAAWEFWTLMAFWVGLLVYNWQFFLFMIPFYYLGQCFTALIAYYEHLGSDSEIPTATGVSTYAPVYNWMFLNNGYHAEHHYRPKHHWTKMEALRQDLAAKGMMEHTRVMMGAHYLGFLEKECRDIPVASKDGKAAKTVTG